MENNIIGRFAISNAGHDKGTLYVVIAKKDNFLYLCDGKYHTLAKAKKKSMKHASICRESIAEHIIARIVKKEKIFDHEIKYAIKQQLGKEEGYVKE